ncbi:TonB-dependent receptor [Erythrobacter westpacificensis]|uniref:TonB-dependent receptor n=1 Tax=Erythrobacter westpacificensis TaxID=1055231 RepID=A0ABP9KP29_9SPHN
MRRFYLVGSAIGAIAAAMSGGSAMAQEADAQTEAEDTSESSSQGLGTIVVTAQRREESLQDAAIAIDAFAPDDLVRQGVESAKDLGRISPSLGANPGGGPLTSLFVRGVGALTVNPLQDSGVAQNYDGVYLGRSSTAAGLSFYDMERVELLKGPQGTLYGRNATGGVLNYIPNRPELGDTSGYIQASYGNFDAFGIQGAVNVPLGDTVAFRVAGSHQQRDGYNEDGTSDLDAQSVRAQLLFEPTDRLSFRIAADHTEVGGLGTSGSLLGFFGNAPGTQRDFTPTGVDIDCGATCAASNAFRVQTFQGPSFALLPAINTSDLFQDLSYTGVNAELNYELDAGTITVIPAYREYNLDYTFVGPGFAPAPNQEQGEQFSIEARFTSDFDGPLNGVFGFYYFDEEIDFAANFYQVAVAPIQNWTNGGDSWAAFAQLTFDVTEEFRISVGGRYTEDSKFVTGDDFTFLTICPLETPPFPGAPFLIPDFAGCQAQNYPALPPTTDPQVYIDGLIAGGFIPPNSTINDGFYPLINGSAGFIVDAGAGQGLTNSNSWNEPTYRVGLEYDVTPENLLYATYERGYRAGGVELDDPTAGGGLSFDPEFIDAFTIGSKNRFLNDRLQLNFEAFYWEYKGQQITYFSTIGGAPNFGTANGNSTIQGFDIDFLWAVAPTTTFGVKFQYLDATLDNLTLVSDPATGRFGCDDIGVVGGLQTFECAGTDLLYSPEVAVDVALQHVFELGDYDLTFFADASYRSEQQTDLSFTPETVSDEYITANFQLTFGPADQGWSISAFINNAFNERYLVNTNVGSSGAFYGEHNPRRTYGLRARAEF